MKTFHRMDQEAGILSLKVEARRIHCSVFDLLSNGHRAVITRRHPPNTGLFACLALLNEFDLLGAILTNPLVKVRACPGMRSCNRAGGCSNRT